MRRTDAALSIREYLLVGGDTILVQYPADLFGRLEPVGLPVHQVEPFQVHCAGQVAHTLVAPAGAAVPLAVAAHIPQNGVVHVAGGF